MSQNSQQPGVCAHCGAPLRRQLDLAEALEAAPPERKARRRDPFPSKEAARHVFPRVGSQRYRILLALRDGPGTARDLSVRTGMEYTSISTRLTELRRGSWIEVVGERKTHLGSLADLVALAPGARAKLAEEQEIAA